MPEYLIAVFFFGLAFLISEYYNRRIQRIHEERIKELKQARRMAPPMQRRKPHERPSA